MWVGGAPAGVAVARARGLVRARGRRTPSFCCGAPSGCMAPRRAHRGTLLPRTYALCARACACACACVCSRACASVCARACACVCGCRCLHACVRVQMCARAGVRSRAPGLVRLASKGCAQLALKYTAFSSTATVFGSSCTATLSTHDRVSRARRRHASASTAQAVAGARGEPHRRTSGHKSARPRPPSPTRQPTPVFTSGTHARARTLILARARRQRSGADLQAEGVKAFK
jgi:hypothetical protein